MKLALFLAVLLSGANSFAATSFGAWSEWIPYPVLEQKIPYLVQNSVRLHLAVRQDEYQDPTIRVQLFEFLKQAQQNKLEVWLWPLLTKENGYWFNQWNSEVYSTYVESLIQDLEDQGVKPAGVSMDLEPPPEVLAQFLDLSSHLKIRKLLVQSQQNLDPTLFQKMKDKISNLSIVLHGKGIQTHAVTTPFVLEDPHHDQIVQKIFGIPLDAANFDFVSFMAYRSEYEKDLGHLNSRLVYQYSKRAREVYGVKAAIDLGVVGDITYPHVIQGYKKPEELWQDIAAAKAGGMDRIQVYALDGMGEGRWFSDVDAERSFISPKFCLMDELIQVLVRILN